MKKILLLLAVVIYSGCVYGAERVIHQNPYINNPYYRHNAYYDYEVLPRDLSALEKYSMNKIYSREQPLKRLERLENLAFGAIQSGDTASRFKNVENAILSRPKYYTKRTFLGNMANYFAGQATGFTPSIYDSYGYNNLNNRYGTNRINQYSNGIFGGGYNILNHSLGNGSSIRILD